MASIRRLPSGKWQATVLLPGGKRITRSAPLKGTVQTWAAEEERKLRRGEWSDPRHRRVTVGDWFARWSAARVVEAETARGDRAGHDRILAEFRSVPIGALTRLDVQSWVKRMAAEGVGPHAIRRAYNGLATAMNAAVDEGLIVTSPCRRIALPPTPARIPPWFTPAQVDALVAELDEPHASMTLLMVWCGLRWGEAAGLRVVDFDPQRRRIQVVGAMTQAGTWKEYPKTSRSRREIPAPAWLLERLATIEPARGLIFTTRRQSRNLTGTNWRTVWDAAVEAAGVPRYTPHACRHTAASWLVQAGATLYEVQAFLGHEDPKTTMRYAHLAPDAAERIEGFWERITHLARTGPEIGP